MIANRFCSADLTACAALLGTGWNPVLLGMGVSQWGGGMQAQAKILCYRGEGGLLWGGWVRGRTVFLSS